MTDVGVSAGMVSAVGDYKEISRNIVNLIENPKNKESVLKTKKVCYTYKTKEDYLDQLKALWSSCLFS